jgi:hypothetical protein
VTEVEVEVVDDDRSSPQHEDDAGEVSKKLPNNMFRRKWCLMVSGIRVKIRQERNEDAIKLSDELEADMMSAEE